MKCKMQQELANPHQPRDKPPPDADGKLMWLIRRHNGGRDNGCDWCLVVDEINRRPDGRAQGARRYHQEVTWTRTSRECPWGRRSLDSRPDPNNRDRPGALYVLAGPRRAL